MIRRILRYTLISIFALLICRQLLNSPDFDNSISNLVKIGIIFSLFEIFLKPIVKILFLPINLLTLGLFRFVMSIPAFLLVRQFVPNFEMSDIHTKSTSYQGFVIPGFDFQGLGAILVIALIYSFFFYLLKSILLKK